MLIEIPYKLPSLPNTPMHWTQKHRLIKRQKSMVKAYLAHEEIPEKGPWHIILTRLGPRQLDDDNNVASFKYILDAVCEKLHPGLKPGQADSKDDLFYEFKQEKSRIYAIRIEVY